MTPQSRRYGSAEDHRRSLMPHRPMHEEFTWSDLAFAGWIVVGLVSLVILWSVFR